MRLAIPGIFAAVCAFATAGQALGLEAKENARERHAAPEERPFQTDDGRVFVEQWSEAPAQDGGVATRRINTGDMELFELAPPPPGNKLIGGEVADPADWPSSFASRQGSSGCTSTLYGPQAMLIAAHCVGDGRTAVIKIGAASYTGTCAHHPDYRRDSTADWAACKMSTPVNEPPHYEVMLTDPSKLSVGGSVTLCGMGCTSAGGGDGNFGTFRCGTATVQSITQGDNDVVTRGGAALCYGDSGGTAYVLEGEKRFGFGIASRGNIRTMSYLSALWKAQAWLTTWSSSAAVKICGLHADATKCQGAEPDPDPLPELPEWCVLALDKLNACLFGVPRRLAISEPEACRKAHADLFACEEMAERSE